MASKKEVEAIKDAKSKGLEEVYYDDSYVYLVDDKGKDANFKGFDGKLNKDVSAPYIVATGHTKEDWEAYKKGQEETQKPDDVIGGQTGGNNTN